MTVDFKRLRDATEKTDIKKEEISGVTMSPMRKNQKERAMNQFNKQITSLESAQVKISKLTNIYETIKVTID